MNSKAVQLLLTLGLVTTLGACSGGGGDTAPSDAGSTGETTEETKDAETKDAETKDAETKDADKSSEGEGDEGGEGGEGGEG